MKKIYYLLTHAKIWSPASSFMRQLKFPMKISIISLAFLLPILWMFASYYNEVHHNLQFVNKERIGVQYAKSIYEALDHAAAWRYQVRTADASTSDNGIKEAKNQFTSSSKKVETLNTQYGSMLETNTQFEQVRQSVVDAEQEKLSAEQAYKVHTILFQNLINLIDRTTDGSGLALDPDLQSYYLMSAVLMRAPEIIRSTSQLRGLGRNALNQKQINVQQVAEIEQHLAIMEHELALAVRDLDKVKQAAPTHFSKIEVAATEMTASFINAIKRDLLTNPSELNAELASYISVANKTLETQFSQVQKNLDVLDVMLAERQAKLNFNLYLTAGISACGVLLAFYLFMGFYRSMIGGIKQLRRQLISIAMGDLRVDIKTKGKDEMSGLLKELANMQKALRDTVNQVKLASDHVVSSSMEIAQGTQDLSARTESAASALEESSAALEETTSTVQMTADSVKQASNIAIDNAAAATRGGEVMRNVVTTMENIQDSSKKISDIISVIDGIAFQTNILALNAAVEAARAGEQGRGFAVVASEVRALAGRSALAAKEIKDLITHSSAQISTGTTVVKNAGHAMTEIVHNADRIKDLLDEVANGAREQSLGVSQIGEAVSELDRNTQANAVLVEETATAAKSQCNVAVRLAAQVDEFRLPGHTVAEKVEGIDIDSIIDAHRQWKVKLREAIENGDHVDVKTLTRDDCCALGKWIYGDGQRLSSRRSFKELLEKHARFHRIAGQVGELINDNQLEKAEDALAHGTAFSTATSEVVLILSGVKRLGFD
ncbi:methyl-accepting chemotaxis protein [Undibacterium baiyunense]|uniref:CZB domain-containing protein n=1 Tax=Undibacterium baiyunense TaxID=2828731 RepID=A0A941DBF0_9BURK|nr:methyl-accepting chemotaxis protein [Undibacterium baiyunense]MBR7745589.1 CZB domain-containing protein [Undibacterium baiyunense]